MNYQDWIQFPLYTGKCFVTAIINFIFYWKTLRINCLLRIFHSHWNSSAGIGRTGCVIGILNGLRQLKQSYLSTPSDGASNGKNASVDILGIVSNLRLQRGGMVQNSEQYELIHRALCLYHQRYLMKTQQ